MKKILYPFQRSGVDFLKSHFHALLADEPGLGKTIQAITAAEELGLKRVLVVCPASVRLNWKQEVEECLDDSNGWEIISYNRATQNVEFGEYDAIILDEAHFLKNPESARSQAVFGNQTGLARRARYKWCLSGTPVLNRPRELYPILKTLAPGFSGAAFPQFAQRYCGAFFDGRGINTRGASHLDELSSRLEGFMLRRTKQEVMPELPPKILSRVPLYVNDEELAAVTAEEREIEDRESYLSPTHEDFSQLGDLAHLLRLTGEAKVPAAIGFISELLETLDKIVVFARHRSVIEELRMRLEERNLGPVVYQGGMSDVDKKEAVDSFLGRESNRVFIGNIQAAGTGINGLQNACSNVVFVELSWVPGETDQAIDRCHRIGQKSDCVNAYVLHIPGTLESAVLSVQERKTKIIKRLMN